MQKKLREFSVKTLECITSRHLVWDWRILLNGSRLLKFLTSTKQQILLPKLEKFCCTAKKNRSTFFFHYFFINLHYYYYYFAWVSFTKCQPSLPETSQHIRVSFHSKCRNITSEMSQHIIVTLHQMCHSDICGFKPRYLNSKAKYFKLGLLKSESKCFKPEIQS